MPSVSPIYRDTVGSQDVTIALWEKWNWR